MTQQENVLVYKPQQLTDLKRTKREALNAGSVIFLKPEIDKSILHLDPES